MGVIAAIGGAALLGGAAMSASAASRQRRDLRNIANTPPVDIGETYREAISGTPVNDLSEFARTLNVADERELERMLNAAIPGYSDLQAQRAGNVASQLRGELAPDVEREIFNSSIARALSGGYGGSPAARNLAVSDLGLSSLELQQLGMQNASNLISSTPMINPVSAASLTITPQQVLALRSNERAQRMGAQTTAAQAPSSTGVWGSALGQLGGTMLGGGMGYGGGAGTAGGVSTQSILNSGQQLPAYQGVSYGGMYA